MLWIRIIQYENGIYPGDVYAPIKSYLTLSIFSKKEQVFNLILSNPSVYTSHTNKVPKRSREFSSTVAIMFEPLNCPSPTIL